MATQNRSYYIRNPYGDGWTIRWWDGTRQIWIEGGIYQTRAEAREALRGDR